MLDRSRLTTLSWAVLCFALFAILAVTVHLEWQPLSTLDNRGESLEAWAIEESWLAAVLRVVEAAFSTIAMTVLTVLLAGAMFVRNHRRAAYFTVGVMVATSLITTGIKMQVGRLRPPWQNETGLLATQSFPSAHASSVAAFAGIVMVLVIMLVRRAGTRRLAHCASILTVLVVCADRVLLGRHYVTDVTAGALLGAGVVLLGLTVFSPLPRSHAERSEPLAGAVPTGRRLAVILNPIKVEDIEQFRAIVSAQAAEAGWSEPVWHYTTIEDPGTGMAEAAAVAGSNLVLVCGGDGTVREVCSELAGTGIPVGIIPAGTGNLLARNLDVPLYLRSAIDVALTGQDRAIDLVKVSGDDLEDTHFMVMAGMGFDAALMEGVNEDLKKRVGWIAYVLSGLKSLMFPAVKVEISIDDGPFTKHRARTVVVGNVGFLQAGMPLLPDASIDDGLLDIVILHPRKFLSWVPLAVRVLSRGRRSDDLINRMTGQKVVVRAASSTPRQLDGDSIGSGHELRMECLHGRVLVRVPR